MTTTRPLPRKADQYFEHQLSLANRKPRATFAAHLDYAVDLTIGFSVGEILLFALAAVLLAGHAIVEECRHQLVMVGLREER